MRRAAIIRELKLQSWQTCRIEMKQRLQRARTMRGKIRIYNDWWEPGGKADNNLSFSGKESSATRCQIINTLRDDGVITIINETASNVMLLCDLIWKSHGSMYFRRWMPTSLIQRRLGIISGLVWWLHDDAGYWVIMTESNLFSISNISSITGYSLTGCEDTGAGGAWKDGNYLRTQKETVDSNDQWTLEIMRMDGNARCSRPCICAVLRRILIN